MKLWNPSLAVLVAAFVAGPVLAQDVPIAPTPPQPSHEGDAADGGNAAVASLMVSDRL